MLPLSMEWMQNLEGLAQDPATDQGGRGTQQLFGGGAAELQEVNNDARGVPGLREYSELATRPLPGRSPDRDGEQRAERLCAEPRQCPQWSDWLRRARPGVELVIVARLRALARPSAC